MATSPEDYIPSPEDYRLPPLEDYSSASAGDYSSNSPGDCSSPLAEDYSLPSAEGYLWDCPYTFQGLSRMLARIDDNDDCHSIDDLLD